MAPAINIPTAANSFLPYFSTNGLTIGIAANVIAVLSNSKYT